MENDAYGASLGPYKIYSIVDPSENDPPDYRRIVDESGEDYLYPAAWFGAVDSGI